MKECPLGKEDCELCLWNFGHGKCGIFSMAADLSVLAEEAQKQTKLLEYIAGKYQQ